MAEYRDDEVLYIPEGTSVIYKANEWIGKNNKDNIKKIVLPRSVQKIGVNGFAKFHNVEEIVLNDGLRTIENFAFSECKKLKEIKIPKTVESISNGIFKCCTNLEKIVVAENDIYSDMGCNCIFDKSKKLLVAGCKKTIIPEETTTIGVSAFSGIAGLQEMHIPRTVTKVGDSAFFNCEGLCKKSIYYSTTVGHINHSFLSGAVIHFDGQEIVLDNVLHYANSCNGLVLETIDGDFYFADKQLDLACLSKEEFDKMATSHNELNRINLEEMYKLYEWREYDHIPHHIVVEKMPISEIPNFYLNNNRKNWQFLMNNIKLKTDIAVDTVFTLAHALGVFSTDGKESKKATEYISTNLLSEYKIEKLHIMVRDFNRGIKYNPEFAKFFMQNFNGFDFLQYTIPETDDRISLVGACYNNFANVQKTYPERKVSTHHRSECLTPELILSVLTHKDYANVDERAEELAEKAGLYGYTQYQFDLLQKWYLQGLKEKCVFEPLIDGDHPITFKVLEKSDPLGAVIGTITNCCQVAGGVGSHCVEYGMSQPNSTFVVFSADSRIIGQAWIWYDEKNKQITLDNIEVPHNALEDIYNGKISDKEFVLCLKRLAMALKNDFAQNGRPVKNVTIGLGHNDFKEFLVKNFEEIAQPQLLSDYPFYTDAKEQVTLLHPAKICENVFYNIVER